MMIVSYCTSCKHFTSIEVDGKVKCKAFPDGIPKVFLSIPKKHTKRVDSQIGDYVYEER